MAFAIFQEPEGKLAQRPQSVIPVFKIIPPDAGVNVKAAAQG